MGGEELPHDVGGGDVIAADAQAGPHVVAALDSVKGNGRAVLAPGIEICVNFGGLGMLRAGRTAVFFHPKGNGAGYGIIFALGAHLKGCAAAVERHEMVGSAVKYEERYAVGRRAFYVLRAFDGRDGGDFSGEFAGQAIGQHGAIGDSCDVNAFGIDVFALFKLINKCAHKTDIVYVVLHGVGAAGAGVPGRDSGVRVGACAAGIDGNEIVFVGEFAHARHVLGGFGPLRGAMQHHH
jgi:hypothetical protein